MIGLIFGETDLPKLILKDIKKKKLKYKIADLTKSQFFKKDKNSKKFFIGQFGSIIDFLKSNNCKQVIFAGKVQKPNIKDIKLDLKGLVYLPKIIKAARRGDAAILKTIINILKSKKISVLNSIKFSKHLTLKKGVHTKIKPKKIDNIDINYGVKFLKKTNPYSFVQAVIVKNKKVLQTESRSGTEMMLKKIKSKHENSILIKLPKPKQDLKIDLPTIGFKTLKYCKLKKIKGIVLKSKQNIFLDQIKSINFANKHKIFIKAI